MISKDNPILRMNEIIKARAQLQCKLAPFYAALELLQGENVDYSELEHIDAFRGPWLQLRELQEEYDRLAIDMALTWEVSKGRERMSDWSARLSLETAAEWERESR